MPFIVAFGCGLLFGIGLLVSGLANPAKVQNFLDLTGNWDPSLAFVMAGAIAVTLPSYAWLRHSRSQPFFSGKFSWPTATDIDGRLVGGAILFGIGWGLGGFCPGPAMTALPGLEPGSVVFVLTMLFGLSLGKFFNSR